MTPYILHFLIVENREKLGRTAIEVGLRIGVPFRIVPNLDNVPVDSIVISYGFTGELKKYKSLNLGIGNDFPLVHDSSFGKVYGSFDSYGNVDLFGGISSLLAFEHEKKAPRDNFGRVVANKHPLAILGVLTEPLIENAVLSISELIKQQGINLPEKKYAFSKGKRLISWTHDVDSPQLLTVFQVIRAAILSIKRADQREALQVALKAIVNGRSDPYWNFDGWSDLITNIEGKSTFYIYPGKTKHSPWHKKDPHYNPNGKAYIEKLRELVSKGHEIGVHHSINTDTVEGYRSASDQLEKICGVRPLGSRAHYWNTNWENPQESWNSMKEAGLQYDTSLSPLDLGYRNGSMLPVLGGHLDNIYSPLENPFIVLPSPIMDWYAVPRNHKSELAKIQMKKLIEDSFSSGILLLNWHVRTLTDVGPWNGLGEYARNLLIDLAEEKTSFVSANEIAFTWKKYVKSIWLP